MGVGFGFEAGQAARVHAGLPAVEVGAGRMEDVGGPLGGGAMGANGAPLLHEFQPEGGGRAEFRRADVGCAVECCGERGYSHGASFGL